MKIQTSPNQKQMSNDFNDTAISDCVLVGLLAGISATLINIMVYIFLYTSAMAESFAIIFNPFTIFFGSALPPVVAGIIFSFLSTTRSGILWYLLIAGCWFGFVIIEILGLHLNVYENLESRFQLMTIIMVVISGSLTLLVPYFVNHKTLISGFI